MGNGGPAISKDLAKGNKRFSEKLNKSKLETV